MPNTTGYTRLGALTPLADGGVPPRPGDITSARVWRFADPHGAQLEVAVLTGSIARVRLTPPGITPARSWAVGRTDWPAVEVAAQGDPTQVRLITDALRLEFDLGDGGLAIRWLDSSPLLETEPSLGMGYTAPLGPTDIPDARQPAGSARCYLRLASDECILGAGERTSPLDAHGQRVIFWNTDPPQPHGGATGAMYAAIPFWLGVRNGRAY
ncbi:MAG TPA: hypothetical protein VKQ36_16540, partial [Ktedonobacterales bacterium]|nr:hypothetical protein [Ktedonobacterales bacterium]